MVGEIAIGTFILGIIGLILKYIPVKKAFLGIVISFFSFFCFDLLSGFTHYQFNKSNEILIQDLIKLKHESVNDSNTTKFVDSKITELSKREHYSTLLSRVLLKFSNSFNQPSKKVPQTQKVETISQNINKYSISDNVELFSFKFFSSAWLMILFIVFINIFFIVTDKNIFEAVASSIIISFILLSISISVANLCSLMPVIYNIYVNYLFNFVIGILIPILIIYAMTNLIIQFEPFYDKMRVTLPEPNNNDNFFKYMMRVLRTLNID